MSGSTALTDKESASAALAAMAEMNRISEENGNSEMTLDEINEEIAAARRERKQETDGKQSI